MCYTLPRKSLILCTGAQQQSLHAQGAGVQEAYRQALDVLLLAEESFQCCKNDLLRYVDNQGLLFMDIVWCVCTSQMQTCLLLIISAVHRRPLAVHVLKELWHLAGNILTLTVHGQVLLPAEG